MISPYLSAISALCGVLVLPSVAAARLASTDTTALTAELLKLENERQQAYVAADRSVLERQFAEEYIHTNQRGSLTNKQQELAFYAPGALSLEKAEVKIDALNDYGDTAVLIGTVTWQGATEHAANGQDIDLSGRFRVTRVYVWRDGRWQLATSHASQMAKASPPPTQ